MSDYPDDENSVTAPQKRVKDRLLANAPLFQLLAAFGSLAAAACAALTAYWQATIQDGLLSLQRSDRDLRFTIRYEPRIIEQRIATKDGSKIIRYAELPNGFSVQGSKILVRTPTIEYSTFSYFDVNIMKYSADGSSWGQHEFDLPVPASHLCTNQFFSPTEDFLTCEVAPWFQVKDKIRGALNAAFNKDCRKNNEAPVIFNLNFVLAIRYDGYRSERRLVVMRISPSGYEVYTDSEDQMKILGKIDQLFEYVKTPLDSEPQKTFFDVPMRSIHGDRMPPEPATAEQDFAKIKDWASRTMMYKLRCKLAVNDPVQ